jgi:hypothetical protein
MALKASGRYSSRSRNTNQSAKSTLARQGQQAAAELAAGQRRDAASYNPQTTEASQELAAQMGEQFANSNPGSPQSGS